MFLKKENVGEICFVLGAVLFFVLFVAMAARGTPVGQLYWVGCCFAGTFTGTAFREGKINEVWVVTIFLVIVMIKSVTWFFPNLSPTQFHFVDAIIGPVIFAGTSIFFRRY